MHDFTLNSDLIIDLYIVGLKLISLFFCSQFSVFFFFLQCLNIVSFCFGYYPWAVFCSYFLSHFASVVTTWHKIYACSTQELVALSGAHTLGSKGFGNPTVFDNSYFKVLLEKPWTSSGEWLKIPFYFCLDPPTWEFECIWMSSHVYHQHKYPAWHKQICFFIVGWSVWSKTNSER